MEPTPRSCVLLADRNHGLTQGVCDLLRATFDSVVMVADEKSLFDSAQRLEQAVAAVDLSLGNGDALDMVVRWHDRSPDARLIVLSVHDEPSVARGVMAVGANGFVLKRSIATDLLDAVDAVAAGGTYVSPAVLPTEPPVSPQKSSHG